MNVGTQPRGQEGGEENLPGKLFLESAQQVRKSGLGNRRIHACCIRSSHPLLVISVKQNYICFYVSISPSALIQPTSATASHHPTDPGTQ